MDVSLDDLIKKSRNDSRDKKNSSKNKKANNSNTNKPNKPVKSTPKSNAVIGTKPKQQQHVSSSSSSSSSILSRIGTNTNSSTSSANSGTKIHVSNLAFTVKEEDIGELGRTVGKVLSSTLATRQDGRSRGHGVITFARKGDAMKFIKDFDGKAFDGRPMAVKLDDSNAVGTNGTGSNNNSSVSADSIKSSIINAAYGVDDGKTKFQITLKGHDAKVDNNTNKRSSSNNNSSNNSSKGSNQKKTVSNRKRGEKPSVSMEDLDAELDSFRRK